MKKSPSISKDECLLAALLLSLSLCAPACSQAEAAVRAPEPPTPSTFAEQAKQGKSLYAEECSMCHGAAGAGTKKAPPLIGAAALPLDPPAAAKRRKAKFQTAKDVFEFAKANMPLLDPGSLSDAQAWAIVAFVLEQNGVTRAPPLDAAAAATITLHP